MHPLKQIFCYHCYSYLFTGKGAEQLALAVEKACNKEESDFDFLYSLELSIEEKLKKVVSEIYRGDGIEITEQAAKKIELFTQQGFAHLPICIAKTHLSFSGNPTVK
eukprot:Awhi_evm1s13777